MVQGVLQNSQSKSASLIMMKLINRSNNRWLSSKVNEGNKVSSKDSIPPRQVFQLICK